MKLNIVMGCIVYFVFSIPVYAGKVISDIPENPDAATKYIFYVHGSVEEAEGSTEKYETAVEAIAESSATVISEVRGETEPNTYAEKLKGQVNSLIDKGVPAKNITVSGYSKGAIIALATAGTVQNADINYVLLAGCSESLNDKYSVDPKRAAGRVLSVFDSGDDKYGTCSGIVNKSDKVKFKEIELDTGKGHKLFRIPKEKFIEKWRDPLVEWAGA
jgi:hypothetical protein